MKKFLNHLLTDILLALVIILTVIILGRTILAGGNIYNIVKDNISEQIGSKNIENGVLKNFLNEEDAEAISEYINENEFDEELGSLISSYFKYTSGIEDEKPNIEELEEVIKEATKRYEEETGKKVDEKTIGKAIDTMNKVLEETTPAKIDKRIKKFLNLINSDSFLTLIIVLILAILGLIFILNKSIIAVVKSSAIVTSINTAFLFILSFVINKINTESILYSKALKYFVKLSIRTAIYFLIISIILIIILVVSKKLGRKNIKIVNSKVEESKDEEEKK